MTGGIGCVVSSAITLFVSEHVCFSRQTNHSVYIFQIFFPRSIATESGYSSKDLSVHEHEKGTAAPFSSQGSYREHDRSSYASSHVEDDDQASPTVAAQNISLDTSHVYSPGHAEPPPDETSQDAVIRRHHDVPLHSRQHHPGMAMPSTSHGGHSQVSLHPYVSFLQYICPWVLNGRHVGNELHITHWSVPI